MIKLLLLADLGVSNATTLTPEDFAEQFDHLKDEAPWIVLLTGASEDASEDSYLIVDYWVDRLRRGVLAGGGTESGFVAVPSRSDAWRRGPVRAAERTLQELWDQIADDFWSDDELDERRFVADTFRNFTDLTTSAVSSVGGDPWANGLLPGDGSATIGLDEGRLGLIALNTAFRSTATEERSAAALGRAQLNAVTGGNPPHWAQSHDAVCVVMSAPAADLDDPSRRALACIAPDSTGTPLIVIAPAGRDGPAASPRSADGMLWIDVPAFGSLPAGRFMVVSLEASGSGVDVTWESRGDGRRRGTVTLAATAPAIVTHDAPGEATAVAASHDPAAEVDAAFLGHLESGRMVAVLGDNFAGPVPCRSDLHEAIPAVDAMLPQLFRLAFGEAPPSETTLDPQEMLEAALDRDRDGTLAYLEQALTPASQADLANVARVLDAPWSRVYDLTVALASRLTVTRSPTRHAEVVVIDGSQEFAADRDAPLELVQLRGSVDSRDVKGRSLFRLDVTAGTDAKSAPAWWSKQVAVDVTTSAVVFIGSSVIQLWPYIAMRHVRRGASLSPAYLICDEVPRDIELRLQAMRVSVLSSSVEAFASTFLRRHQEAVVQGRRKRAARWKTDHSATGIRLVSRLRADAPKGNGSEYLRGFQPTWGDVRDGLSVSLAIEKGILGAVSGDGDDSQPLILTGRAGTGKTSTLMRLALQLDAEGRTVGWIDRGAGDPIQDLVAAADALECDVVLVDDADAFGLRTGRFLTELSANGKRQVLAAMRTPRYESVIDSAIGHTPVSHDIVLSTSEIWDLLNLLDKVGLLGELRRLKTRSERFQEFKSKSDSELLIGLYEVTFGRPFTDRLKHEFAQLGPLQQQLYSRLAVATHLWEDEAITEREVTLSMSDLDSADVRAGIEGLVKMRFLKRLPPDRLRVRHRVFADVTVQFLARQPELLADAVGEAPVRVRGEGEQDPQPDATGSAPDDPPAEPHADDRSEAAESGGRRDLRKRAGALDEDFHYWLQRGAYAIECGELLLGENYLIQARNCDRGGDDFMVLTEWGQLRLRLANAAPDRPESMEHGREGLMTLLDVARKTGRSSPHTFAILARDGTQWLTTCSRLGWVERRELARASLASIEYAVDHLRDNRQAEQAARSALPQVRALATAEDDSEPFAAPMV